MSTSNQALQRLTAEEMVATGTSTNNSADGTKILKWAETNAHLVSPATALPNLPIGCEVAFSRVKIDANNPGECYVVPGSKRIALGKVALEKIAKGVGVTWDPVQSHRTDDGQDPHFASFRVVGVYRHFDGTIMQIIGEKQMDLRDGSESAKVMKPFELSMARKFIAEHAETKARLRAIRSLGIQASYEPSELDKPFVTAKLMLTGRVGPDEDPTGELQKILVHNISASMLGAASRMYGEPPLIAAAPQTSETGPPTSAAAEETSPAETKPEVVECPVHSAKEGKPIWHPAPACEAVWLVEDGRQKGTPISELDAKGLESLVGLYLDLAAMADERKDEGEQNRCNANRKRVEAEIQRRAKA